MPGIKPSDQLRAGNRTLEPAIHKGSWGLGFCCWCRGVVVLRLEAVLATVVSVKGVSGVGAASSGGVGGVVGGGAGAGVVGSVGGVGGVGVGRLDHGIPSAPVGG